MVDLNTPARCYHHVVQNTVVVRFGRCMRLVDITPQLAAQWLATLRPDGKWPAGPIDEVKVQRYAHSMRNGTWELLEMPIIHKRGRLLSSRHRMLAVIEANMTVPMFVCDEIAEQLASRRAAVQ